MLTCSDCERCLQDYLDQRGEVTPPEVKAHLDDCRACRERFAAAKLCLDSWINQSSPLPSVAFTQRVLAEVKRNQRRRQTLALALRVAAGLLVLVGITAAGWIISRPKGSGPEALSSTAPQAPLTAWQKVLFTSASWKARSAEVWQQVSAEAAIQVERASKLVPHLEDENWLHADAALEASLVPAKALKTVVFAGWQPVAQHAEAALVHLRDFWQEFHSLRATPP